MPPTYNAILTAARRVIGELQFDRLEKISKDAVAKRVSGAMEAAALEGQDASLDLARRVMRQGVPYTALRDSAGKLHVNPDPGLMDPRDFVREAAGMKWVEQTERIGGRTVAGSGAWQGAERGNLYRLGEIEEFIPDSVEMEIMQGIPARIWSRKGATGVPVKQELLEQWLADKYRALDAG